MTVKLEILLFFIGLGASGLVLLQVVTTSYLENYIASLDEEAKAKVPYLIVAARIVTAIGLINGCLATIAFWCWSNYAT